MSLISSIWGSILSFKNLFRFKRAKPVIPQNYISTEESKELFFSSVFDISIVVKKDLLRMFSAIVELNYTSEKISQIKGLEIEEQITELLNQVFEKQRFSEEEKKRLVAAVNLFKTECTKQIGQAINKFSSLRNIEIRSYVFCSDVCLVGSCNDIKKIYT